MRPGKGTIGAHHNKTVEIKFMLLYTTTLETFVKLVISSLSGDTMATIYLPLKLVGALSPRLDPNDIELEHTPLASGAFGAVFRGTYRGQVVAVKVVKHQEGLHDAEKQDFVDECNLMHKLHHQYIVGFIGASYVPGKMCVCSELMTHGSLSHYLESDIGFSSVRTMTTYQAPSKASWMPSAWWAKLLGLAQPL
ncbi:hypothetical protein Pelo_5968 [Pelomyxa schiedti]|nr:hypothetical protein Pelo_5968 [Pelomyxa schiedti]